MIELAIGLIVGALVMVPLTLLAARRAARRVRWLEQRARAAERLAETGRLTGGLAHEIKNPLSTVGLNVQLLQEDLDDLVTDAPEGAVPDDKVARMQRRFESLTRETQRLRDILEDFLRFAGRIKLDQTPTDVHPIIEELADFFAPQAQQSAVNLRLQLTASPSLIRLDADLFKQALLNLMINATQAMTESRSSRTPSGGNSELIVRTDTTRMADQRDLLIHVTDTGPGMPPETAEKIFQPYFSTKSVGTGLGLPTTRRIIEEHGGTISVHSEPGRGTDFQIALPLAEDSDTSPHENPDTP